MEHQERTHTLSFDKNIPNSFHCLPWLDDYGIRNLLCAVIQTAVEDYRYAKRGGLVCGRNIITSRTTKGMTQSEMASLIDFFYQGGLEAVIEAACLQDDDGHALDAPSIVKAL